MVTRVLAVALAMTMPAFFVAACGDTYDAGSDGDGDGDASPTAVARAVVVAPIDELDLIIRESFPPQYAIRIVSDHRSTHPPVAVRMTHLEPTTERWMRCLPTKEPPLLRDSTVKALFEMPAAAAVICRAAAPP
jgi:hypothetical protein